MTAFEGQKMIDRLAKLEHEQWAQWAIHFLEHSGDEECRERWWRQANTEFENLSEEEKEKDRYWATQPLKALLEPTPEMVIAGAKAMEGYTTSGTGTVIVGQPIEVWQAMIEEVK